MAIELTTELLQLEVLNNTVKQWGIAIAIGILADLIITVTKNVIAANLEKLANKTSTQLDNLIVNFISSIHPAIIFSISVYLTSLMLKLPVGWQSFLSHVPIVLLIIQAGFWAKRLLEFGLDAYAESRETEADRLATLTMIGPLNFIGKMVIWALIFLLILDNVGFDVTAMITGLGIGGIAVALAVQNVLGDLLAALSIVIDKPFVVGDFIIVDDMLGNVEKIGLKTTRVRSLSGEQLIFSNSDLLSSRIRNYKRMYKRRIVFQFGVLYQTKAQQLRQIPQMVKDIIAGIDKVSCDRSNFASFGDSSLDFETVYFVDDPDYNVYMNVQEQINIQLFEKFAEANIDFAYPTRTLFISHENSALEKEAFSKTMKETVGTLSSAKSPSSKKELALNGPIEKE